MGARSSWDNALRARHEAAGRSSETMKKKFLLGAVALLALGASAPAVAADLARPHLHQSAGRSCLRSTIGAASMSASTAAGATANRCFDQTGPTVVGPRRLPQHLWRFRGRPAGYRWQMSSWVFGFDAPGRLGQFARQQRQPDHSPLDQSFPQSTTLDCSPARSAMPGIPRCCISRAARPSLPIATSHEQRRSARDRRRATTAGAARSVPASNSRSRRTGRPRSNTTTCSLPTTTPT